MDYLQQVFGGLNPQTDQDAAVKLALNAILMDGRLEELSHLLIDGHDIGGVEGEPGWIIERRDMGSSGENSHYSKWPMAARFHVHVAPTAFELACPDMFMNAKDFHRYVGKAMNAYLTANSNEADVAQMIISQLLASDGYQIVPDNHCRKNMFPHLFQFFGGYFHQDWPCDYEKPDDVIRHFILESTPEMRTAARQEIALFLELKMDEVASRSTLFEVLGCSYYYPNEWPSANAWLQHVLELLQS